MKCPFLLQVATSCQCGEALHGLPGLMLTNEFRSMGTSQLDTHWPNHLLLRVANHQAKLFKLSFRVQTHLLNRMGSTLFLLPSSCDICFTSCAPCAVFPE